MSRYGKDTRESMARLGIGSMGDALREIDRLLGVIDAARSMLMSDPPGAAGAWHILDRAMMSPGGDINREPNTEAKRLREAIETHRRNIWGDGEVKHDEDVQLYAALGD